MLSILNRFSSAESPTKITTLNYVTKAKVICVHWMRSSVYDPNVSFDCLVSIVIKYYPLYPTNFEWDARRTHDCLYLSKDATMFSTRGRGVIHAFLNLLSAEHDANSVGSGMYSTVCSKMISADTVSVVRWEVTVRQMNDKYDDRGIRFFMGFVDGAHIDEFKIGLAIGALPHQAAFNPTQELDYRNAMRVFLAGEYVAPLARHWDQLNTLQRLHETADYFEPWYMKEGDKFELCFDFKAGECIAFKNGRQVRILTDHAPLPKTLYLAASVRGLGNAFQTTLFECE